MSQKRMWTKYELKTIRDPRLTKLPRSQRLMYFEALAHANEYGTDGVIEYSDLRLFTDASKPAMIAQAFVAAGLWSDVSQNDGQKSVRCQSKRWRIVDFLDEQLSAEEVQTRAKNSAITTERNRRHKAGDHSKCDPKRCWALQNVTRHDPGHVTTDVTSDVTMHDTKRHETKRSESGVRSEVEKKPPAPPPSAGAPGATPPESNLTGPSGERSPVATHHPAAKRTADGREWFEF
ncbi:MULTISPECIES: hypothetical protein [unclassified Rhodococcus (in: high G+C Gram-positive bacteria)]|uniref:hypothetical protein n=1 Tax=unclassified Rhodococcus (in: high G+C Gram-positive bacteria) TaxID=192944 RepID=UPI000B3C0AE4|nr:MULTISPECIES: hypothetical protein [unclassified Rhodococcus (in: high G+C Gram-positive bacteria)]